MRSLLAILAVFSVSVESPASARTLTLYAAASTAGVVKDIEKSWTDDENAPVRVVYGSSGALARQISAGAPADVYFSANEKWVDYLIDAGRARAGSLRTVAGNSLVLIAPAGSDAPGTASLSDILRLLGKTGRLAIGDPRHVPAGAYAKEALTALGLWAQIDKRTARTGSVRHALALVQRGEVPLGIVYRTDVRGVRSVRTVADIPGRLHSPIRYQAVEMTGAQADAGRFLAFLISARAQEIFRSAGFAVD